MTSLFATGTKRRNSPSWCKKGMFTTIAPTINERPKTANAYVQWTGHDSGGAFEIIESFRLRRNVTDSGWYGLSSNDGDNVTLDVLDTLDPAIVNVQLNRRYGTTQRATTTWPLVPTTFRPPWGTNMCRKSYESGIDVAEVQILA